MPFTRPEIEQMYDEWYKSKSLIEFKEYWGLTSEEMKEVNGLQGQKEE